MLLIISIVAYFGISAKEQIMLVRFLRFAPPRFFGVLGEDAYEFLISCKCRLHYLGTV